MADWARLLSECWGLNLSRGFESLPPRQGKRVPQGARFSFQPWVPIQGMIFESLPPRQGKRVPQGARFSFQPWVPIDGMVFESLPPRQRQNPVFSPSAENGVLR